MDSLPDKFKDFSDVPIFSQVMAVIWVKMAQKSFLEAKHIEGKAALAWYFKKSSYR